MSKSYLSPRSLLVSAILVALSCMLAFSASAIGVSDNFPGIALAFLAAFALVFAFVHPLRTSKHFRFLIYASGIGFVLFAILHNVFDAVASNAEESSLAHGLLNNASAGSFLLAILVCPSGLLVGAIGTAILSRRERRSKSDQAAA